MNNSNTTQCCLRIFELCIENGTAEKHCANEHCRQFYWNCIPNGSNFCPNISNTNVTQLPALMWTFLILIALCSVLANGFICVVYASSAEIRTAKHYFIVNLGVADMFIALFGIPFYLTQYAPGHDKTLCRIGAMIDVMCCTNSIASFAVISVERYVAVRYPLRYNAIISRKRCLAMLVVSWCYSIVLTLASLIPFGEFHMDHCIFFTCNYLIATTFASFLIPLLAMLLIYGWIFKIANAHAQEISRVARGSNRVKREFKAAKTLTLIIGAFVLCWLPFFVYIWIFTLNNVRVPFPELIYIIQITRYMNGLVNPFIYVGINKEFRRTTFKLLKKILPHNVRSANNVLKNNTIQSTLSNQATLQ